MTRSSATALVALLAGCGEFPAFDSGDSGGTFGEMLDTRTELATSTKQGYLTVDVDISGGETAFLVTGIGQAASTTVALESITSPNGDVVLSASDWLGGTQLLSQAFYALPVGVAQWPIREQDAALATGTWQVKFATYTNYSVGTSLPVDITTLVKRDDDFSKADINVRIVWADGVDQEPGLEEAMAVAVERWRTVWANEGVTLVETYDTSNIDADLAFGWEGDQSIENAANRGSGHDLQVILGDYVAGDRTLYGVSAGIPGSVVPSEHTFVLVSWLVHAGNDGEFSDEETRILGETLAHETGHFLGLAHPVEADFEQWDALGDTEKCGTLNDCHAALGSNLMFPYPVCSSWTDCDPQGQMTPMQGAVMNRYTGAL